MDILPCCWIVTGLRPQRPVVRPSCGMTILANHPDLEKTVLSTDRAISWQDCRQ
jgi:hypothetical protein